MSAKDPKCKEQNKSSIQNEANNLRNLLKKNKEADKMPFTTGRICKCEQLGPIEKHQLCLDSSKIKQTVKISNEAVHGKRREDELVEMAFNHHRNGAAITVADKNFEPEVSRVGLNETQENKINKVFERKSLTFVTRPLMDCTEPSDTHISANQTSFINSKAYGKSSPVTEQETIEQPEHSKNFDSSEESLNDKGYETIEVSELRNEHPSRQSFSFLKSNGNSTADFHLSDEKEVLHEVVLKVVQKAFHSVSKVSKLDRETHVSKEKVIGTASKGSDGSQPEKRICNCYEPKST